MDRKFYPENFEKFLRGHADQFKMSPSKKVWHGIYNDLHPGRRWPSVAMSMLFIFTLVIIGHLNTNNGRTTGLNDISNQSTPSSRDTKTLANNPQNTASNRYDNQASTGSTQEIASENLATSTGNIATNNDQTIVSTFQSSKPTEKVSASTVNDINTVPSEIIQSISNNFTSNNLEEAKKENAEVINTAEENLKTSPENKQAIAEQDESLTTADQALNILKAKRKSNVSWSYYFTPSLGYRFFSDENLNSSVKHQNMFGHEVGSALNIKLFKNLELTSGLQLNYSGYSIKANNTHPVIASLQLNEPGGVYSVYSTMSHYGNSATNDFTKLKNYSVQASIPLGLQYMFAETENFEFGAAASVQPTFILASNAFMLSTDKKNYLTNSDVMRKWNMNTSFSTYISFASNSLRWQIGPQVRYQLMSTYNKRYPVTENLVNYGIRVGISKSK